MKRSGVTGGREWKLEEERGGERSVGFAFRLQ
jgi:hypothetical protein